jgi:hypothetical protein
VELDGPIYTREEAAQMRVSYGQGATPECPRCLIALHPHDVQRPQQISYVRERIWWVCPGCRRSLVVDASSPLGAKESG